MRLRMRKKFILPFYSIFSYEITSRSVFYTSFNLHSRMRLFIFIICLSSCFFGTSTIIQSADPLPKLYVLPASFSMESHDKYGKWIEKLQEQGFGNAVWQELEEVLYDTDSFELILESPANVRKIRDILDAKNVDLTNVKLPDKILTINTNFFVKKAESASFFKVKKTEIFDVTVYLRYYELDGPAINIAIPAMGEFRAENLMDATRQAVRKSAEKLLHRIERKKRQL